jgi:hypothetical protein
MSGDFHIISVWLRNQGVGIRETSLSDAIDTDHKCISEGATRFRCRADEVSDKTQAKRTSFSVMKDALKRQRYGLYSL